MPDPLWKIRQRKGMSVNQLAAKSGVPAISITEYETGRAIRSADLPKLARALYVDEWDIEIEGSQRPSPDRAKAPSPPLQNAEPPQGRAPKRRQPAKARPTQIEHLLNLTERYFDTDRQVLEQEIGKPLEELDRSEASELLRHYQRLLAEARSSSDSDTGPSKRKRAYLPEGVDEFELKYLTAQQESGALIHFQLFDGQKMIGRIIGFSPYSISILEQESQEEVTLQKLAIAYYRVIGNSDQRNRDRQ
jgi:transcriptional regulator with XRE-family HTH domain